MCILNLYHIKPEVSMVWQMYIFCHHNTCSFHFCGTKLMYVYCIKRVPRLHQRAPNGTQIFKISRVRSPGPPPKGGGHPLPYPPPVSAAPTQKAQAPSSVSRLNGYLNRLNFFLATSLLCTHSIRNYLILSNGDPVKRQLPPTMQYPKQLKEANLPYFEEHPARRST